jgi:hypothetical protein
MDTNELDNNETTMVVRYETPSLGEQLTQAAIATAISIAIPVAIAGVVVAGAAVYSGAVIAVDKTKEFAANRRASKAAKKAAKTTK